ncbi:MAG: hypothetical protein QOD39_1517 [Mycobacterium sp.]|jgi:hypothetical protein|nr:hypothetical protein [Mycobacterium sp.]
MGNAIGEMLPLAVALACGPLPIIALVLILVSGDADKKGIGFVFGRLAGLSLIVAATLVIFSLIGDPRLGHRAHPVPAVSIARIVIGLVLMGLAVRLWRQRNAPQEASALSKRVDGLTVKGSVGMGLLVSAVDPASISLGLLAGVDIAGARLSISGAVVVAAAFIVLSTLTITVPLIGYFAGGQAARRRLGGLKEWLETNEQAVMMVMFLIVGALLIGRGIRDLTGV